MNVFYSQPLPHSRCHGGLPGPSQVLRLVISVVDPEP